MRKLSTFFCNYIKFFINLTITPCSSQSPGNHFLTVYKNSLEEINYYLFYFTFFSCFFFYWQQYFRLSSETCRCTEHLSVALVQSPLDLSGFTSLASVITDLLTTTCGACEEHNDTKLVSADSVVEEKISFPVIKTQAFGDTEYNKFIPVINVPGIVVIGKKGSDRGLLTKAMANSIFHSWPIFVFTMAAALLAGIIIWILVSC